MSPGRGKKSALQICNKPYCSTCQSYITAPTSTVTATAAATSPSITTTAATITATATPAATPTAIPTTNTVLLLRNGTFKGHETNESFINSAQKTQLYEKMSQIRGTREC